ncbi:MAG: hypothetical protein EOS23_19735 [Mesorhizobium sp.]|uniref:hypothetical protein n=1 Tax=Mesorhizobium sp. TaxID=1871066 RepID=UPI000FEA68A3|nr:hypothetical protein [Mesorhizobium sp.]RWC41551.1 MAG: hypothetical protein EOS28_19245 [Mesorhizobium sp.]RWD45910.1 MAG: hypothetical protein EOS59_20900 [Mesorhizobium sp.]RWE09657.1 MAG: hypothetical protein EOS23_19735 [Mesorhizobium sp.]RWE62404.1 MAG: hypothetical protein EOS24_07295 [Mesorhizobium sp.]RWE88152.1 MAG: hypothetical protein EOS49_04515 [Mesorhizobium sp.]
MTYRAVAAITLMLVAAATPALATESIVCSAEGDAASIDVLMGHTAVIAVARVWLDAGDRNWTTDGRPGSTKVFVGQAFEDDQHMAIDLTDEGISSIVAKLRLVKASEQSNFAMGGTLSIDGVGAWAVTCPEF